MKIKSKIIRFNWFLTSQLGINFKLAINSVKGLLRYLVDLKKFCSTYHGTIELAPCLHDWHEEGGSVKSEYFWQDLLVARIIFNKKPKKHVDVGSRIDGFVAHLATFREVEVWDVRPISSNVPGLLFKQVDLSFPLQQMKEYADSLSCLHALEHFGLGRYGDQVNPNGYKFGFANMALILKRNGLFYLSVPVGIERVEFNANRVFNPNEIITLAKNNSLELQSMIAISSDGEYSTLEVNQDSLNDLACKRYTLLIFIFVKI